MMRKKKKKKTKQNKGKAWAQCNFELGPGGLFTQSVLIMFLGREFSVLVL